MNEPTSKKAIYSLELYVSGESFISNRAIESVTSLCNDVLQGRYELKIIDLQKDPEKAVTENIVVVPTLIRKSPEPKRQIIGDLQNPERVMRGLEIHRTSLI